MRKLIAIVLILFSAALAWAEYADIVINTRSEEEGVAPVIYPHWFHRIRYQCSVCHVDLGIRLQAGGNGISMQRIIDGEFCGACHNGDSAWSVDNCNLCHSGKPGLETGIRRGAATLGPGVY